MKLGKKPALPPLPGSPRLAAARHLWTYPDKCSWVPAIKTWPMLLNDALGDCVEAGALHIVQCWRTNAWGSTWEPDDADALAIYKTWAGYAGTPETDQGTIMRDAVMDWSTNGIKLPGAESVPGFAVVNPQFVGEPETAIADLGGVLIGLQLPIAAQDNPWVLPEVMTKDWEPNSWGGHCVPLIGYDHSSFTCITWGEVRQMSKPFFYKYCDEAYALISTGEWLSAGHLSPSRLSITQLGNDMRKFRSA